MATATSRSRERARSAEHNLPVPLTSLIRPHARAASGWRDAPPDASGDADRPGRGREDAPRGGAGATAAPAARGRRVARRPCRGPGDARRGGRDGPRARRPDPAQDHRPGGVGHISAPGSPIASSRFGGEISLRWRTGSSFPTEASTSSRSRLPIPGRSHSRWRWSSSRKAILRLRTSIRTSTRTTKFWRGLSMCESAGDGERSPSARGRRSSRASLISSETARTRSCAPCRSIVRP